MNFDTWVQLHEASRISSEPILQRYFERPTELREPTDEERRSSRSAYEPAHFGRHVESLEADEAAIERAKRNKRDRDRRREARKRQEAEDLAFNGRTIAGDEPVPEAS